VVEYMNDINLKAKTPGLIPRTYSLTMLSQIRLLKIIWKRSGKIKDFIVRLKIVSKCVSCLNENPEIKKVKLCSKKYDFVPLPLP
jgi:hypothetical protein